MRKKYNWTRHGTLDRQQRREAVVYAYALLGSVHGNAEVATV